MLPEMTVTFTSPSTIARTTPLTVPWILAVHHAVEPDASVRRVAVNDVRHGE